VRYLGGGGVMIYQLGYALPGSTTCDVATVDGQRCTPSFQGARGPVN
jgi:hypothetical protein